MSPYDPSEWDKKWLLDIIALVAENGIVGFPHSGLIYKVKHSTKTFILLNPRELTESLEARKTHQATIDTLASIGWNVTKDTSKGNGGGA